MLPWLMLTISYTLLSIFLAMWMQTFLATPFFLYFYKEIGRKCGSNASNDPTMYKECKERRRKSL